eukprot:6305023-Pyramimonas_sp.AAC.1
MRHNVQQCRAMRSNVQQREAMQSNAEPRYAVQSNAAQCKAKQCKAMQSCDEAATGRRQTSSKPPDWHAGSEDGRRRGGDSENGAARLTGRSSSLEGKSDS